MYRASWLRVGVSSALLLTLVLTGCAKRVPVEDGAFELTRWWGTGERPVSVKLHDLNLDGQLDIVWANQLSNTVGVVISHP